MYEKKLAVEKDFNSDLISDNKTGPFWSVVLNMKIGFCSISQRLSLGGEGGVTFQAGLILFWLTKLHVIVLLLFFLKGLLEKIINYIV